MTVDRPTSSILRRCVDFGKSASGLATEVAAHALRRYTLFNWTGRYRYKALEASLSVENLLNTEWREAQLFFASRLQGEPAAGVPDTHFVPGNPRTFLGGLTLRF